MQNDKQNDVDVNEEDRPVIPRAAIIYGDIIYWATIAGTFLVMVGSVITFTTTNNFIDPGYLLSQILDGNTVDDIWNGAEGVNALPSGHWYLDHITTGNGMTMAGIAIGVFSVTPAIFASAYALLKDGEKLFAGIATVAGLITVYAMMP